jgi:hypothetical protein
MRHGNSRELHSYWNALRGPRAAPDRAEIDPAAIRGLLADTFILEAGADDAYPLRLSGTRVEALWGRDGRGLCFTTFWRPIDRCAVAAALAAVVEEAAPAVAAVRSLAGGGALEMELLLLPLRHFGRGHARILGALSPLHCADGFGRSCAKPLELISTRRIGEGLRPAPARRGKPKLVVYTSNKQ